jgi:hypothetical protein
MANERLSMRKTREILRLKWELGRNHRDVAASLGVGPGTVNLALERAIAAELSWPDHETQPSAEKSIHAPAPQEVPVASGGRFSPEVLPGGSPEPPPTRTAP